ncbi:MAG: hypothetical protein ABI386_05235 [Rhodanobacter sp.]
MGLQILDQQFQRLRIFLKHDTQPRLACPGRLPIPLVQVDAAPHEIKAGDLRRVRRQLSLLPRGPKLHRRMVACGD